MPWLNESGALRVSNIVNVLYSIRRYSDHIECYVVTMQTCQLLLGRPWLFDRDVQICGRTNKVVFMHKGERLTLLPLSLEEIFKDDLKRK
jgi:hypothetical protein